MSSDLVNLAHETEQHEVLGTDVEFWQENAYTFVGTSNGMDFMLYTRVCIISGQEGGATELNAREYATAPGMTYVSPYNDWDVVAGQATVGVEIYRELPDVDVVVASLGGGGLISGIAGYLKEVKPGVRAIAASAASTPGRPRRRTPAASATTPGSPARIPAR